MVNAGRLRRGGGGIRCAVYVGVPDEDILVRTARPTEAEAIARVHSESRREGYEDILPKRLLARPLSLLRDQWSEWLRPDDLDLGVLVAERGGNVVGVALYECRENDDPELRILYVHPSAWRSGIGRSLVDAVVDELRKRGAAYAVVWTFAENVRGRRFYEAVGWSLDDEGEWEGLSTVRYRRQLDAPRTAI